MLLVDIMMRIICLLSTVPVLIDAQHIPACGSVPVLIDAQHIPACGSCVHANQVMSKPKQEVNHFLHPGFFSEQPSTVSATLPHSKQLPQPLQHLDTYKIAAPQAGNREAQPVFPVTWFAQPQTEKHDHIW